MAQETAVTAPPIGVSRSQDFYMNEDGSGLADSVVRGRLLGGINQQATSSNSDSGGAGMALTGAYTLAPVLVGGKWLRMCKLQGYSNQRPLIPLQTFQPTTKEVGWPQGRYVWEGVFYWTGAPAAGVDSGLVLGQVDTARMLTLAAHGIMLGNVAGVLKLTTRGAGGLESIDVSQWAGPLNSLNKLTLIVRQPGKGRPASLTALVNDRIAAAREWVGAHKLPLTEATFSALSPQLAHGTLAVDCWVSNLRFSSGPDIPDL